MTITIQPAAQTALACRTNPNLWLSTEHADRALAVHTCQRHCPFLAACKTYPPTAGAVQAGVLHDIRGEPVVRQPKPTREHCGTCRSTSIASKPTSRWDDCGAHRAYRRHKRRGEEPCEACKDGYRQRERDRGARRRQSATSPCGTLTGLTRHRDAGEPPCDVCMQGQRDASARSRLAQVGDESTQAARVQVVRELAALGLSDVQIGARLAMSKRRIRHLRVANGIPAGWSVTHRVEVAA